MREIHTHKVNGCNDALAIHVEDDPGAGGANHRYVIRGMHYRTNASGGVEQAWESPQAILLFQNGPIKDVGTNGITQEALLAIVIDRLQCFQKGPYACRENALALTKLEEAMHWLKHRTEARMARGVEGTHTL